MSLLKARSCCSYKSILQTALQGGKPPYTCGLLPVVKALSDRTQLLQADFLKFCIQLAEALSHIFPTEIQKTSKYWTTSKRSSHISDTKNRAFSECNIYMHIQITAATHLFPWSEFSVLGLSTIYQIFITHRTNEVSFKKLLAREGTLLNTSYWQIGLFLVNCPRW